MTFPDESGGVQPEAISADGSIWLYDYATASGSEVLRFSAANGDLLQTTTMPSVSRPIIAANVDGFWMGADADSFFDYGAGTGIYFAQLGARTARLVQATPDDVTGMSGSGHIMNVAISSRSVGYTVSVVQDLRFVALTR